MSMCELDSDGVDNLILEQVCDNVEKPVQE